MQVNTVALQPGNSATDPEQDGYEGCEGSWQRCKVEAHKEGVPHTLSQRWLRIVVHCAEVCACFRADDQPKRCKESHMPQMRRSAQLTHNSF